MLLCCWVDWAHNLRPVTENLYPTIDELEVENRLVLVRVDLNVPITNEFQITDFSRLQRILPTLQELSARRARIVLMSHFGRPKGRKVTNLSLSFLGEPLSHLMGGVDIAFAPNCIGNAAEAAANAATPGTIALLENLRFHRGEEENDPNFSAKLASVGEVYVNDAFSVSHRSHASVVGVPALLPHAAGRSMQGELESLSRVLRNPAKPVMAIIGGAKISTKLGLLGNLSEHVDVLAIGGGMANTLLYASGFEVGISICEPEMVDEARHILERARKNSCEVLLPIDVATVPNGEVDTPPQVVSINEMPRNSAILDIGPKSSELLARRLEACKTLVWNGPLGLFETPPFDASTNFLAGQAAMMTELGTLTSIAGGGDTLAALNRANVSSSFTYVSTAGGAFLEWLEGKILPGVEALRN